MLAGDRVMSLAGYFIGQSELQPAQSCRAGRVPSKQVPGAGFSATGWNWFVQGCFERVWKVVCES